MVAYDNNVTEHMLEHEVLANLAYRLNQPDLEVQVSFSLCVNDVMIKASTLSGQVLLDHSFPISCETRDVQLEINCAAQRNCRIVLPDGSSLRCDRVPWMQDLLRQQGLKKMSEHDCRLMDYLCITFISMQHIYISRLCITSLHNRCKASM